MNIHQKNHKQRTDSQIVSLPRALSKLGFCSRSQAEKFIIEGRVFVNGKRESNNERRVDLKNDKIEFDNKQIVSSEKVYLMLHKPRGLVTTTSDEKGRETVYECFPKENFPTVFPVGRLDKASEGLLLFTNDTQWAANILEPKNNIEKIYHVQINKIADEKLLQSLRSGIKTTENEFLSVKNVSVLRSGEKNCWLEIILNEGKNRHIRKIFDSLKINVLQLIRISIGMLKLGKLERRKWKYLSKHELRLPFECCPTPKL
ncbi:MAG: rRNA pseudouridine synthase [Ignavibacteriales bacterium]|nr:rRNA pseudouridine synthase [Ignavibacteriales bacterium]